MSVWHKFILRRKLVKNIMIIWAQFEIENVGGAFRFENGNEIFCFEILCKYHLMSWIGHMTQKLWPTLNVVLYALMLLMFCN